MSSTQSSVKPIVELTGRCACGAVTFTAEVKKSFGVCHCRTCRRWAGGVWMGVVAQSEPTFEGPINRWNSSAYAERANCKKCGGALWHKAKRSKKPTIGLGLFDDQEGWEMKRQIFIEEQPDHYGFGDKATGFTGWATLWALLFGKIPN